ncbi:MAG: hypothetical protein MZV64_04475 [Ignavibacteriales bacterium]|nr:hypothetical protein [Ignavibacteriales bacterium]
MEKLREEGDKLIKTIAAIPDLAKFKDQIQITITKDGLRIELIEQAEGLFFDIGSARLKPDAVQLLRLIASRIGTFPNDVGDRRPHRQPALRPRPGTTTGTSAPTAPTPRAGCSRRAASANGRSPASTGMPTGG